MERIPGSILLGGIYQQFIDDSHTKKERNKRANIFGYERFEPIKTIALRDLAEGAENTVSHLHDSLESLFQSLRFSKKSGYSALKDFFLFIRKRYQVSLKIENYMRKPPEEGIDRLIDMLKILQGKGKSRRELRDHYTISDDTLRSDLTLLETGIDLLGQHIQVTRTDSPGNIAYDSSVHPVFLPLNLTEAYALTVGLKRLPETHPHRELLSFLGDWVYSQLSEYAKGIIKRSCEDKGYLTEFSGVPHSFRDEKELLREREFQVVHYEKCDRPVKVDYHDSRGEQLSIEGRIKTDMREGMIVVLGVGGNRAEIRMESIIVIEELQGRG